MLGVSRLVFIATILLLLPLSAAVPKKPQWDPIPPADLAAHDSSTGAEAEILLSRETLEEDEYGLESNNYVRAKIYTQGGIERSNLLRVTYRDGADIRQLAARVVKPSGASTELAKSDFHESVLVKEKSGPDLKQIAFAFPNLEPGDVVEYQWKEYSSNWRLFWYYCQEEIPIRELRFVMEANNGAVISWQNCPQTEPTGAGTDKPGITIRNLPGYVTEPFMPPEHDVRGWIRLVYDLNGETPEKGWHTHGRYLAEYFARDTRPNGEMKQIATDLTAGAATAEEKLRRLYEFCQSKIINYSWDLSPEILREKEKLKKDYRAARDTLKLKKGSEENIDYLFAGLARAAGFDVRRAQNASREAMLNVKLRNGYNSLDRMTIAVKVDGQWHFYSPGVYIVPFGMNYRNSEGTQTYVTDEAESFWATVPTSPANLSTLQRKGRFQLDAEGNLKGDVEETASGHKGEEIKDVNWQTPTAEMEKNLRSSLTNRLPTAEISDIRWENLHAGDLPVVLHYKVEVPGYAQRVGQRLVWATNYFTAGTTPVFTSPQRRYSILFPYAWKEHDDVEITLPEGYELDQPTAPASVGRATDPLYAAFKVRFSGKRRVLSCERDFAVGTDGHVAFPAEAYPAIKPFFDAVHQSETHTLVMKPKAPAPAPPPAPVAANLAPR